MICKERHIGIPPKLTKRFDTVFHFIALDLSTKDYEMFWDDIITSMENRMDVLSQDYRKNKKILG